MTHVRSAIHGIAWAPDERSIVVAFATMSVYGTGLGAQLWRASLRGDTPPVRIDATPWGSFAPSINRSRHRLVFGQDRIDIDIFRFEGERPPKPVTASSFVDYAPSFSPDSRRIAFESSRSGIGREIWVADPDGSNAVQVTRPALNPQGRITNGNPNWSPDGRRIVFSSDDSDSGPDLFTTDADGGARRQVTNDRYTDALPTWSHDGRWIYYRQDRPQGSQHRSHPVGWRLAAAPDQRAADSTPSSPGTEQRCFLRKPRGPRPYIPSPLMAGMSSACSIAS